MYLNFFVTYVLDSDTPAKTSSPGTSPPAFPASAKYPVQFESRLQMRQTQLYDLILGLKKAALGIEHIEHFFGPFAVTQFPQEEGAAGLGGNLFLKFGLLDAVGGIVQGILHFLQGGKDRLAVIFHQFELSGFGDGDLVFQAAAVKQCLGQGCDNAQAGV